MGASTISVDEFQALEQKVLQTVELIKKEREARHNAEAERDAALAEASELRERLAAQTDSMSTAQEEVVAMQRERENVRERVEKMLAQMDELL
ncbi:MAG TPA: hypothetical protein VGN16_10105 [Acidobacteriaceae bacterium]|jgi:hypothetical protein